MSGYHEQRAILLDNEAQLEIEVRGGVESDDMNAAYDVTVRFLGLRGESDARTMRVSVPEWRSFVAAVRRLQ